MKKIIITTKTMEELRELVREKKELESMMAERGVILGSPRLDGMPKGNRKSDPTGVQGIVRIEIMEKWERKCAEIDKLLAEIETRIDVLKSVDRRIIRLYYFKCLDDRRIAKIMHLHADSVGRKRRDAVYKICDKGKRA